MIDNKNIITIILKNDNNNNYDDDNPMNSNNDNIKNRNTIFIYICIQTQGANPLMNFPP